MTIIDLDLGYCRINHRQASHNLQIHSSISLDSHDWQSNQSASLALMAFDYEHSSRYVKRPGMLRFDCKITLPDDHAEVDGVVDDEIFGVFETSILHAELWTQLQWQLHSVKQNYHSTRSHAFELTFSNIDERKKKSTHRLHQDVPFYNVPAPVGTPSIDILAITLNFKVIVEDSAQASKPLTIDTTKAYLSNLSNLSPMLIGDDEVYCSQLDSDTDDILSICSNNNERASTLAIENTMNGATCKSLKLNETLATMFEAGLRSVLSITPGRMPKHVSLDSENMAHSLSQIAPSAFLPNYASNMAGRMAFVSRIATAFSKLDMELSAETQTSQQYAQISNVVGDGVIQRSGQARWECILWNSAHADLLRQLAHKPLKVTKRQKQESQLDLILLEPASDEEIYQSEEMLDSEFGDDCSISCLFDEDLIED